MALDERTGLMHRSRLRFLESGGRAAAGFPGVRPDIQASWRRSLDRGLVPTVSRPVFIPLADPESLTAAARPVLRNQARHLDGLAAAISLTDHTGHLLLRSVPDRRFEQRLDHDDVVPGFSFAESLVGTNSSAMVLATGRAAIVAGPEHFRDESLDLTCVGAPVRHPLSRRIVGTLNLTCFYEHTSPLLLAWVSELAAEVEQLLIASLPTITPPVMVDARRADAVGAPEWVDLDGLVGNSPPWTHLRRRLSSLTPGAVILRGEAGTGKSAVAHAWLGKHSTVDLAKIPSPGRNCLLENGFEDAVDGLVLRHLDRIDPARRSVLAGLLALARERGLPVVATCAPVRPALSGPFDDLFDALVEVPALADRTEDLGLLLEELTWRRTGGLRHRRWTAQAVDTVARVSWPANVAGLEALVGTVLAGRPLDRIDVGQLPVALRAQAARRPLHGLEKAEAQAIIEAMERFGGNKKAAADSLGIARSTLYRKVRALGLDLTARSAQNGQSSVPASIGRGTPVT